MTENDLNRLQHLLRDAADETYYVKDFQKLVETAQDYLMGLHDLPTEQEAKDRARAILECYLLVVQAKLKILAEILELASSIFRGS